MSEQEKGAKANSFHVIIDVIMLLMLNDTQHSLCLKKQKQSLFLHI